MKKLKYIPFLVLMFLFTGCSDDSGIQTEQNVDFDEPWWLNRNVSFTIDMVASNNRNICSIHSGPEWLGCTTLIATKKGINICKIEIVTGLKKDTRERVEKHEVIHCMGVKHGDRMVAMMKAKLIVSPTKTYPAYTTVTRQLF